MDHMTMYEAKDIAKNVLYVDKNQRELDRYKIFVAIQSNSKNKIDLKSIMELPWDNVFLNKTEFKYDEKEEEMLDEKAKQIEDMLNNGKIDFKSTNLMNEDKNISTITNCE